MRTKLSARPRAEEFGKASEYIERFNLSESDRVFIACRVSASVQGKTRNPADQEQALREAVEASGAQVVGVEHHVGTSYEARWMFKIAQYAERAGANVILVESTNRFIRHPSYHSSKNFLIRPRTFDLKDLVDEARGIKLMTFLDPYASPSEERSFATRRGQRQKGRKGGRRVKSLQSKPQRRYRGRKPCKRIRDRWKELANKLHREEKLSLNRIAEAIIKCGGDVVSKSTIGRWIQSEN